MNDWVEVNAAASVLTHAPESSVPAEDLDAVQAEFGSAVADEIAAVLRFTKTYDPDWSIGTFEEVREVFRARLVEAFPSLSAEAVHQFDRIFAFDWK